MVKKYGNKDYTGERCLDIPEGYSGIVTLYPGKPLWRAVARKHGSKEWTTCGLCGDTGMDWEDVLSAANKIITEWSAAGLVK